VCRVSLSLEDEPGEDDVVSGPGEYELSWRRCVTHLSAELHITITGVPPAQNPAKRRPRAALHKPIPATQPAAATHGGHRSTRATLIREAPCPSPCASDNTKSPSFAISNAHSSARAGHGRRIPDRRSAQRSGPHAPSWCRGPVGLVADPRRVRVRTGAEN
jgi:hypothetical protein